MLGRSVRLPFKKIYFILIYMRVYLCVRESAGIYRESAGEQSSYEIPRVSAGNELGFSASL